MTPTHLHNRAPDRSPEARRAGLIFVLAGSVVVVIAIFSAAALGGIPSFDASAIDAALGGQLPTEVLLLAAAACLFAGLAVTLLIGAVRGGPRDRLSGSPVVVVGDTAGNSLQELPWPAQDSGAGVQGRPRTASLTSAAVRPAAPSAGDASVVVGPEPRVGASPALLVALDADRAPSAADRGRTVTATAVAVALAFVAGAVFGTTIMLLRAEQR